MALAGLPPATPLPCWTEVGPLSAREPTTDPSGPPLEPYRHNLPRPMSPLIGRSDELAAIGDRARGLRGYHAASGDRRGEAAGDPGGNGRVRCCPRAALPTPQLPLAGLGQHLAVVLAGELADEARIGEHGLLLPV